jgi:hypothetical protein
MIQDRLKHEISTTLDVTSIISIDLRVHEIRTRFIEDSWVLSASYMNLGVGFHFHAPPLSHKTKTSNLNYKIRKYYLS